MIHNVLSRQLPIDAARVDAALAATGIDPDRRPQTWPWGSGWRCARRLARIPGDRAAGAAR
jgi:hypothetical protein